MNTIDLTPLYRSTIGFDRLASLIDSALSGESVGSGYPPYNIESLGENKYAITLAVAGFERHELDIKVEQGVLTIRGKKAEPADGERKFIYQGIANRAFERKFNLADYVEVVGAELNNGLLTVRLVKEIPEAMKPKTIEISSGSNIIEHKAEDAKSKDKSKAA